MSLDKLCLKNSNNSKILDAKGLGVILKSFIHLK